MTMLDRILHFFHLVKESNYNNLKATYDALQEKYTDNIQTLEKLTKLATNQQAVNDSLLESNNKLNERIASVEFQTMEQYKTENEKCIKDVEAGEKYYKEVQKQVSNVLHNDLEWKFPNAMAFPGSTVMNTDPGVNKNGEPCFTIKGRIVLPDDVTGVIQHKTSINDKYNVIVNNMVKLGLMDRVVKSMIQFGLIEYTIGYNSDCTTCEVYYQIIVDTPQNVINLNE